MVPFNKLMLTLLGKAITKPNDAAQAAGMLETMQATVRLWLTTEDSGVAAQAGELLYQLLRIDLPPEAAPTVERMEELATAGGQGLVAKRLFGDRDVYVVFFESCSLEHGAAGLSKGQKTIAQARLMEWLPRVGALHWSVLVRSHHRGIEEKYGVNAGAGLLDFAALRMVDYKDDVLMHRCLIDFYTELLVKTKELDTFARREQVSPGLRFLIDNKLHDRTTKIYLDPYAVDAVDRAFLYGPAANYLAAYASLFSHHYTSSSTHLDVNSRLRNVLTEMTPLRWAHTESPSHDLRLLARLPRTTLLPYTSSPVALLPSGRITNADVLNTLAAIFHGPDAATASSEQSTVEGTAARAMYYNYLSEHRRFWEDLTLHAGTPALLDQALAAVNCLTAVITARWSTTATESEPTLPTNLATPASGPLAILSPPSLEYTLPFLLSPAQRVGGVGDAESAAYKVAVAKFEALAALRSRLAAEAEKTPGEGFEEMVETMGRRLGEGVWGRRSDVGGSVGTMEL
ncbi:hypothetical protein BAUCODRAFT_77006 [Baudoinia panamericana UAMH 10762]|uniref:Uncharacterized protein n=1 Tax=Baudoinia panamericana (strain UAMH 10762) TaxID=717646 RepID=M2N2Y4_BAUPA|nr:uncharacterized protein BAUCODRAFT_77006 [Baudoinia panamericana UAMH 10762]EMC93020.1 hypothetical protein BAUCODRAFT_77006 [Baudoinia panamericana UAMH 10762]